MFSVIVEEREEAAAEQRKARPCSLPGLEPPVASVAVFSRLRCRPTGSTPRRGSARRLPQGGERRGSGGPFRVAHPGRSDPLPASEDGGAAPAQGEGGCRARVSRGVTAAVCAWFFSNVADILVFVYDFWAPTMILPFLVAVFWYHPTRMHAVVVSMVAGIFASIAWRFGLESPGDIGPALFGVTAASVAFVVALPLTKHLPTSGLFEPNHQEDPR